MKPLTNQEKIKFWIRVYLGTNNVQKLKLAVIDRAYRDFNRTMHGIGKVQNNDTKKLLSKLLLKIIDEITLNDFDQKSFDLWHKSQCDILIAEFYNLLEYTISYGQAQKWINMTLKYLFVIGSDIINGIDRNYQYFHIPIDNIIQDKLTKYKIERINLKWSRINNYEVYFNYQKLVRKTFVGQIPIKVEFKLFNE
jgi:hypothetical protein